MNSWKFKVDKLGKLQNVELNVSPFMIFVGENNSGKSYLMEFLWGIITNCEDIANQLSHDTSFRKLINSKKYEINKVHSIEKNEQKLILRAFNNALIKKQTSFSKKIFNYPIEAEGIEITRDTYFDLTVESSELITNLSSNLDDELEEPRKLCRLDLNHKGSPILSIRYKAENNRSNYIPEWIMRYLYEKIAIFLIRKDFYSVDKIFSESGELNEPIYFPASRTGFMHTYRAIIGNQRNNKELWDLEVDVKGESNQIAGTSLTLPTVVFLEKLQKINIDQEMIKENQDILNFFESNILKGKIGKNSFDQFEFIFNNGGSSLPLHVTSSLIAELSPMYLFLNSTMNSKLWIIEEIESHLNPKIQIEVMRLLVRLFNNGKSIWITTHSDSLIQRFNNLITLSYSKKKEILEKLDYTSEDIFEDLNLVKAFEFECHNDGGYTTIKELEITPYGFEFKVFNDVLTKLVNETYLVQEASDEDV